MAKTAIARLEGISPYSQSRPVLTPKHNKETADAYELRTWMNRVHCDNEGVYIPAMAFRNCLAEAAKYLSIQIPGKGKATFTKHFESGLLIPSNVPLFSPVNGERIVPPSDTGLKVAAAAIDSNSRDIEYKRPPHEMYGSWVFTPVNGVPGGGTRVWKCYPIITSWTAEVTFLVIDDVITKDVFYEVLLQSGMLIGLGRFRVRNRGTYGSFVVNEMKWSEELTVA